MSSKVQPPKALDLKPRIAVIGVGGAGSNAVNNMIASGLKGVQFIVANTDAQALATSSAEHRIQLGVNLTEGLGAGSKPEIGEAAAEEALDDIRSHISGCHMVFIAAGMGGGTGTGAAAVIARVAQELGILTVGVVTKPFQFEGSRRMRIAEAGVAEIKNHVDTLIVIPNQNLFRIANEKTTFAEAFALADQVLYSAIACIVDLIIKEGLINLDLADVRTVMVGMGAAMMGTGEATGANRASLAAEEAIANPLLDDMTLRGAKGLLISIIGGRDLTLYEVDEAASRVRQEVDPEANIIVGAAFDESMGDRIRVSIVASGMGREATAAGGNRTVQAAAVPPARAGDHPRPRRAPGPPPPPAGRPGMRPNPRASDELTRALSEAIDQAARADGQPGGGPRSVWKASDGVVFEEPTPNPTASQPRPRPEPGTAGGFQPAPPADIKRASRRMPELSDFPPVAQREYRAKADASEHAESRPRRPTLFERLTGSRRREDANQANQSEARYPQAHPEFGDVRRNQPRQSSPARDVAPLRDDASDADEEFESENLFRSDRKR